MSLGSLAFSPCAVKNLQAEMRGEQPMFGFGRVDVIFTVPDFLVVNTSRGEKGIQLGFSQFLSNYDKKFRLEEKSEGLRITMRVKKAQYDDFIDTLKYHGVV